MLVTNLAVYQYKTGLLQGSSQMNQGDLRCIGTVAEHGLTAEHRANSHPVEATRQLAFHPAFHRVGITLLVKAAIGLDHGRRDPGALFGILPLGAGAND